jgi:hypothetical protein
MGPAFPPLQCNLHMCTLLHACKTTYYRHLSVKHVDPNCSTSDELESSCLVPTWVRFNATIGLLTVACTASQFEALHAGYAHYRAACFAHLHDQYSSVSAARLRSATVQWLRQQLAGRDCQWQQLYHHQSGMIEAPS